ncbi:SubName: Full=Related to Mg2 transporter protein, CorA-like {ECO:0000313/EMBL:CCA67912.1} [Serendipita indica DSM 11827]|nr:SubName: Full=Related to Mg2 transporter protein, CorA-like {ECO:0000313/EMBL:CCA67912.1} [Serendipita indica DSM 11827]
MPREDSEGSSGGSITSDEEEVPTHMAVASEAASATVAGTVRGSPALQKLRSSVNKLRHIRERCEIEIIDYSASNYVINQYNNEEFVNLMQSTGGTRPGWAKVRWINIGGTSWDVLSKLAIAYKLHPLTLENIVAGMPTSRSRADYYTNHLFLHVMCQSLEEKESSASPLVRISNPARSRSPAQMNHHEHTHGGAAEKAPSLRRRKGVAPAPDIEMGRPQPRKEKKRKSRMTTLDIRNQKNESLKRAEELNEALRDTMFTVKVTTKSLFLYLLRDGTVISVHQADRGFGDPIYRRLQSPTTVLRASSDPSMLLEALLDLVVDRALDIVDRYHENILAVERSILLNPKMVAIRQLHFFSRDLTARRRELDPVKTLIYGLRRYDKERCAAVAESAGILVEGEAVQGFLSHKAKIYLADVHEHCEWILTSFEMQADIAENLINYTFNTIAYETNNTMRTLTLATIIFLPLTFLSGYFGMNFEVFGGIQHSDAYFWEIAAPVFVATVIIFLWHDLRRMWHFLKKKTFLHRFVRTRLLRWFSSVHPKISSTHSFAAHNIHMENSLLRHLTWFANDEYKHLYSPPTQRHVVASDAPFEPLVASRLAFGATGQQEVGVSNA